MNTNDDDSQPELPTYEPAALWDRAFARIIDVVLMAGLGFGMMIIVGIVSLPLFLEGGFNLFEKDDGISGGSAVFLGLAVLIFWSVPVVLCLYEVVYTSRRGYTPGKGPTVQVIRWEEYLNPTGVDRYPKMFHSFLRWAVLHCLFPLVVVSVLFGKDRRGWHDKLAGTVVVDGTDHAQ